MRHALSDVHLGITFLKARGRSAVLALGLARSTGVGVPYGKRNWEVGGVGGRETWGKQKFTKYLSFSLTCSAIYRLYRAFVLGQEVEGGITHNN